jgi:hypothetical protein
LRAANVNSISPNAVFVKVMQANAVQDIAIAPNGLEIFSVTHQQKFSSTQIQDVLLEPQGHTMVFG